MGASVVTLDKKYLPVIGNIRIPLIENMVLVNYSQNIYVYPGIMIIIIIIIIKEWVPKIAYIWLKI